jgi:hypothetical protein
MYNPEQQPAPPLTAARMSFSSDFALEPPPPAAASGPARSGDADFEFSPVGSRPMMAADQLFSKGRILPLREARGPPVTLRDELVRSAPDAGGGCRVPRWKELLGLNKRSSSHKQNKGAPAADAHV